MADRTPAGGLVLVDGSALAYRSHYAMARSGLSRADGLPTGATYGFTSELQPAAQGDQADPRRRRVRLARADFPSRALQGVQGDPPADAGRARGPARPDPRVRGGARRAGPHAARVRGGRPRRLDRGEGPRPGAGRLDRHGRQGLPADRRREDPRLPALPADGLRRHHRPRRRHRALRGPAGEGGRRARPDGRLRGQRPGRPRHRREDGGAPRPAVRHARRRARGGPEVRAPKRLAESLATHKDTALLTQEARHPPPRVPRAVPDRRLRLEGRRSASTRHGSSARSSSRTSRRSSCPSRSRSPRTTGRSRPRPSSTGSSPSCSRPTSSRSTRRRRRSRSGAPCSSGSRSA